MNTGPSPNIKVWGDGCTEVNGDEQWLNWDDQVAVWGVGSEGATGAPPCDNQINADAGSGSMEPCRSIMRCGGIGQDISRFLCRRVDLITQFERVHLI